MAKLPDITTPKWGDLFDEYGDWKDLSFTHKVIQAVHPSSNKENQGEQQMSNYTGSSKASTHPLDEWAYGKSITGENTAWKKEIMVSKVKSTTPTSKDVGWGGTSSTSTYTAYDSWGGGDYSQWIDDRYTSYTKYSPKPNATLPAVVQNCSKCKETEEKLYSTKDEVYRIHTEKVKLEQELNESKEEIEKLRTQVRSLLKRI